MGEGKVYGIELKVIKEWPSKKNPGSGEKLRVVQWVYPTGSSVKIEKRGYYLKEGKTLPGKAQGLGLADLELLKPHWKEIVLLMKTPPKPPVKAAAKKKDEEIEEVPF